MYRVNLTTKAQRVYNKLDRDNFEKIDESLESLKSNPRLYGVKKIRENIHRIRVGNWRIIYAINDRKNTVTVGKIVKRSEDTYNGIEDLF